MLELYFLLGFMILGAIIAVEVRDLLSSVVAVGAVGLGLSLVFLVLKAPDLAVVQLVVEILAVIILIRATVTRETKYNRTGTGWLVTGIALIFIAAFLWFAWDALNELPDFGSPLMNVSEFYCENGAKDTGATNIVTAIILDYRGYDTLGEGTVLFTAVIGVLAVCRSIGRKKPEENAELQDD
jgi:multicomponent Na+:H+ antiporter subunit B